MLAALNHPNIAAIDGLETGQVGRDGQDVQAAHEQGIMHRDLKLKVPDATMMAVPVTVACTSFEAGTPVALFPTRIVDGGTVATNRPQHAVARDGRFLINQPVGDATAAPITLLLNWRPPASQ